MYSGTTIRTRSGRIMGVHQRLDRLARRNLNYHLKFENDFPSYKEIVHFEGLNGPDGIKRKSPGQDEPWHFINPLDKSDTRLITYIENHYYNLTEALKNSNRERVAFEAAWMAHAITDGLTPAHHFPLEEALADLRGKGLDTRNTKLEKVLIIDANPIDFLSKNWKYWGAGGYMNQHVMFELGVAAANNVTYKQAKALKEDYLFLKEHSYIDYFYLALDKIFKLKMYDNFRKNGWTAKLARQTNDILIPVIAKAIEIAWYSACRDAGVLTLKEPKEFIISDKRKASKNRKRK